MKLSDVKDILNTTVLVGEDEPDREVTGGAAGMLFNKGL